MTGVEHNAIDLAKISSKSGDAGDMWKRKGYCLTNVRKLRDKYEYSPTQGNSTNEELRCKFKR